ncbi:hypothetical protein Tco_0923010 [Tanacetum coccineum]|uniref:Retrovirus-related Pol polyprotein from transposon TNT 1-94-like beta-barrel domain-containing protein n=1 Tax=Tanacetum coccineum TaxID=301880 RepID=A0ABQ5CZW7_9ASTR
MAIQFNVDKFENASKSLNKIIEIQIYRPISRKLELKYEAKPKAVRKNNGAPIIEDWVSDSEEENVSQTKIEKKTAKPSFVKIDFVKAKQTNKTDRKTTKQVDCNYQRVVKPIWNNAKRVNHQNFAKKTHPCPKKNMVPRAVLMKSGLVSINTARQNISKTAVSVNTARQVNTAHSKTTVNAARPMSYLSKTAHSTVKRPIHKNTTFKNRNFNQRVNTVKDKNVNTVRPKAVVNAARPKAVVNVVKGNNVNAVKASACWVWKPKTKVLDHVSKHNSASITLKKFDYGNPQMDLQDKGVIDSGCSRHMTGNMSYLTDYEEIDGGYVAFGGNPKGGKITGKDVWNKNRRSILFWATVKAKTINGEVKLQALMDGKKIIITESIVRRDLQLKDAEGVDCLPNATIFEQLTLMGSKTTAWNEFSSTMASAIICLATNQKFNFLKYIFESMVKNLENVSGKFLTYPRNVADEAVYEEMDDSLERAATTATSLDAEQDRGGGPRCRETMGDTISQTGFENVSKHSNDLLLIRGNTLRSGEDSVKLQEFMELCTTLQLRVLDLETTKTTQATKIAISSSRRVESSDEEGLGEEDASKQGRIADIDADAGITLDSTHFDADIDMLGVHDLDSDEVIVDNEYVVTTAEETRSVVEEVTDVIIPVTLEKLKSATPKADKVMIQEPEQGTTTPTLTTTTAAITITAVRIRPRAKGLVIHKQEQAPTPKVYSQQPSQEVQDKGKGKMVEPEPVKKMSKKDLLRLDEELAFKLQAEEEEEMLAREKA